jgi:nucleotide-binding universal stress UspA family protein
VNAHILGIVPPVAAHFRFLARNHSEALDEGRRGMHHAVLRRQVHQAVGRPVHFSTGVEVGPTLDVINSVVGARGSRLVLVGLEPKETPHRAAGEQLALRAASAGAPVLAVPVAAARLPRRALVAVDFGTASIHAARAAITTMARGGTVTLAFVASATGPNRAVGEGDPIPGEAAVDALHRLVADLGAPDGITIDTVILEGDPASALLRFAPAGGYDLIAMGSRTTPRSRFRLAGSVCLGLLRSAMGAVLIAPPPQGEQ